MQFPEKISGLLKYCLAFLVYLTAAKLKFRKKISMIDAESLGRGSVQLDSLVTSVLQRTLGPTVGLDYGTSP